jgi:hypothetical protein
MTRTGFKTCRATLKGRRAPMLKASRYGFEARFNDQRTQHA